ncbi:MAG: DUF4314 domain-containing protein [Spirochaetia bacterium]|nr:DUF4314 domain-containing protein [Spirochaetia bacterium]
MDEMSKKRIEVLKSQYPKGCTVELVSMDDEQAPPAGTKGEVMHVDDTGTIHVIWQTGSTLGVVPGIDLVKRLGEEIPRHKIFSSPLTI